ncbi:site-specific integrase [Tepidibacillus fermentans]|uniref:Site-specific recombinase XerD n=1 Tax=Tepidibacillus fermentans TaxID=1281767 RepID=A0A4R3KCH9_9BACI|nr:site-specific integrase [Tepidibacillus fermentans]TCS80341.1 site-specific recombinase XerD [Tepidibacillus fermentans]
MKGHVRKRGSKWVFVIDVGRDEKTGKRIRKWFSGFNTKKEAEKAMAQKIHELNMGTYVEPSKLTLGDYLYQWLENYAKVNTAPRTYEGYEMIIKKHIIPSLGHITLDNLKPLHIQRYYSDKLSHGRTDGTGGLSAQTVLHHHRVLKEALEQAVKWQLIVRNVADAVEPPRPKKVQMVTLNKQEISKLLETAKDSPFFPIIFTAIYTGMRRGEILGLRWRDINFHNRVISVRQTLQAVKGKGLIFKEPKNGKERTVSIPDSLIDLLKKQKIKQNENKLRFGPAYNDFDLVFAQPNGNPFQPSELSRGFNKIIKKAEITPIRFHDLRHTHATLLLEQGVHPKIVSERLGHSSINITLDTYSHVLPNMQEEAANKFDDLIKKSKI